MPITASELRARIYRLLDEVIATGRPIEIDRKGTRLKIVLDEPPPKLSRLLSRDEAIVGDPDDLVHVDWSTEWRP